MSYRNSSKNRRLKRSIINIIRFIRFESINLPLSYKFVVIWIIMWFISLFLSWVNSTSLDIWWTAFSQVLWLTGYIIWFFLIINLIFVFNKNTPEKLKSIINLIVKDWNLIIFIFLFNLILTTNTVFFVDGLNTFKEWITIWQGVIFEVIANVFWMIWWYLILIEKTKTAMFIAKDLELDENGLPHNQPTDKNNMKLPF